MGKPYLTINNIANTTVEKIKHANAKFISLSFEIVIISPYLSATTRVAIAEINAARAAIRPETATIQVAVFPSFFST
jgi:hypothetical protein